MTGKKFSKVAVAIILVAIFLLLGWWAVWGISEVAAQRLLDRAPLIEALTGLAVLVVAVWAARVGIATMRVSQEANEQARKDSIEQTRPYVYVEVVPSLAGLRAYDLRIVNAGKSAARELTLDYSDWPVPADDIAESVRELFETPRALAPGASIRCYWRIEGPTSESAEPSGMGTGGTITVSYWGSGLSDELYVETYDVMIENSGFWPTGEDGISGTISGSVSKNDSLMFYRLVQAIARHLANAYR